MASPVPASRAICCPVHHTLRLPSGMCCPRPSMNIYDIHASPSTPYTATTPLYYTRRATLVTPTVAATTATPRITTLSQKYSSCTNRGLPSYMRTVVVVSLHTTLTTASSSPTHCATNYYPQDMTGLIAHRTISTDARVVKGADLRSADRRIAWVRTPLRAMLRDDIIWPRSCLHRASFAAQSITHSQCRLACPAPFHEHLRHPCVSLHTAYRHDTSLLHMPRQTRHTHRRRCRHASNHHTISRVFIMH